MKKCRIIPRFDVKGPNVVKGIQLEGLRVVGKPADFSRKYFEQGADEIVYIDIVASLYERNSLLEVIEQATELGVAIPLTVGGGIRSLEDIRKILRAGADKVAINTAATRAPEFISQAAQMFGNQCIVGSVQAKRQSDGGWEAYVDNGRERTGKDAVAWARELVRLGAGELLITSVDREGTRKGMDIELIRQITDGVHVPVIAGGGAGSEQDIVDCFDQTGCDAVSFASLLHYNQTTIGQVKQALSSQRVPVRFKDGTEKQGRKGAMQEDGGRRMHAYLAEELNGSGSAKISIVDYGLGNLRSVAKAFETLGHTVRFVHNGEEVLQSQLLVLPGVGSFADGMRGLAQRRLIEPIRSYAEQGRPLLGICLGMQLMMSYSEEYGYHRGLDLIPGTVASFQDPAQVCERSYHVPHVGWNEIYPAQGDNSWDDTILQDTVSQTDFYFVHSYKVMPEKRDHLLAATTYGGQVFCSVVRSGNLYGTQFHPERCGTEGLAILKNFTRLADDSTMRRVNRDSTELVTK